METWKEVTENGVTFLVSNMGGVKTPARAHIYKRVRKGIEQTIYRKQGEREYTPQTHHTGYREVSVRQDKTRTRVLLHRLVALAFVDGYSPELCVNHINGVKSDNRAENLEWVSLKRNTEHAWETGLVDLNGENQPTHKLSSKRVVYIRKLLHMGIPANTIAIVAGVSPSLIDLIRDGKRRKVS